MITINMAIIVQMINFLVAYAIVRFLLLEPAMAIINQEEENRTRNQETINTSRQTNEAKEDTIQRRWTHCTQECLKIAPPAIHEQDSSLIKGPIIAAEIPTVDPKVKEQLVADIAQKLVQRMSHVR